MQDWDEILADTFPASDPPATPVSIGGPASVDYFEPPAGRPAAPGRLVDIASDLPEIELAPGLTSRPLVGSNLLGSFVRYEPNSVAPLHSHEEEQLFVVLEGELELTLGDEVRRVRAGHAALIPAWVPHGVRSLDGPAYQMDVFSPPRKAMLAAIQAAADAGRTR